MHPEVGVLGHLRHEVEDFFVLVGDGPVVMEHYVHLLHVFPAHRKTESQ